MPPSEPPTAASSRSMPSSRQQRPVDRRPGPGPGSAGSGARRAARWPGRSKKDRSCPCSRRARWRRSRSSRSVSSGLPGPMMLSHQPGRFGSSPSWSPAAWASPERAWQMKTALERSSLSVAVGLVGDLDPLEARPRSRASAGGRRRRRPPAASRPGRRPKARRPSYFGLGQSLVDVGQDVVDVLDADRQPDHVVGDAGARPAHSSSSCEWVVVAGWIASDLASPMLARCENSSSESMNLRPASLAALDAEGDQRTAAALEDPRWRLRAWLESGRPG